MAIYWNKISPSHIPLAPFDAEDVPAPVPPTCASRTENNLYVRPFCLLMLEFSYQWTLFASLDVVRYVKKFIFWATYSSWCKHGTNVGFQRLWRELDKDGRLLIHLKFDKTSEGLS